MALETDFLDLYNELGLHPGCQLAEFKQAYRRRLAALHPDRQLEPMQDEGASARLQRIISLHNAAIVFERQHGRLPGATRARPLQATVSRPVHVESERARRPSRRMLALLGIVVVAWLFWRTDATPTAELGDSVAAARIGTQEPSRDAEDYPARTITVGTTMDVVRQLEGNPPVIRDNRWEYGPSWIRFQDGQVVDWYSSTAHPLRLATGPSVLPGT